MVESALESSVARVVLLVAVSSSSAIAQTTPANGPRVPATDRPPTVKVELVSGSRCEVDDEVVVRVTVDDPDGDPVSARLVGGPPTLAMRPIVHEKPPVVREVRWLADEYSDGRQWIDVAAHDALRPEVVVHGRAALDVEWFGTHATMRALDVDGDGKPELVAASRHETIGGVADAGALCVHSFDPSGRVAPTVRRWHAAAPLAGEQLGAVQCESALQQADLDGDGQLDLVAMSSANGGTFHVWFARPDASPLRPADATLVAGAAAQVDSWTDPLQFHDVTGDGIEDVVVAAPFDSSRVHEGGAVHVFAGGASMRGVLAPSATLTLASPTADDHLGGYDHRSIVFADFTGDGFDDVSVAAPEADWNGAKDDGVVALFAGGPGIVGGATPIAVLNAKHQKNASFGTRPVRARDVTGDGIVDVVVTTPTAVGWVVVWRGGSTLSGTPAADATLKWSSSTVGDQVGDQLAFADLNRDGVLDVISASEFVDVGGYVDSGAIMVWKGGGALTGTRDPDAILGTTNAQAGARLGTKAGGFRLADVTGDGLVDLIAVSPSTDVAGVVDVGAVYVWSGASSLTGTPSPDATLTVPGATAGDEIGLSDPNHVRLQLGDVTGDDVLDVVVPTSIADVAGAVDAGAIYVFEGGAMLAGSVAPCAALQRAKPRSSDRLTGDNWDHKESAIHLADVTGDAILDVVATSPLADSATAVDCGAVDVWQGGVTVMSPVQLPLAEIAGDHTNDQLGSADSDVQFGEVNGDGVLDLAVAMPGHDELPFTDVGRGYVLLGGATLTGTPTPYTTLERVHFASNDLLFSYSGALTREGAMLLQLVDLDGDGRDDVFGAAPCADGFGAADVGVICVWPNGRPPAGSPRGPIELWPPSRAPGSLFGN